MIEAGKTYQSGRKRFFVHALRRDDDGIEMAILEDVTTKKARGKTFPWPVSTMKSCQEVAD